MNFFNFFITRKLVEDKTGDRDRANKLGLLTSMIPGPMGMMMGVMLADREEAPKPPVVEGSNNNEQQGEVVIRGSSPTPSLPAGQSNQPATQSNPSAAHSMQGPAAR
jgi:hypothetical protein